MINIKIFDSNLLKIDKKSWKNVDICYIGYITMKDSDYVKINIVNPLYLIIDKLDGRKKYLIFDSIGKSQKVLIKSTKLWDEIKYLIKIIHVGDAGEYGKDFLKSKFNSDDKLPLNKILNLHNITIVIRFVFQEDVCMNYKC